ncbi:MAG: acetyl-CoA acetyltransferase [Dehalococcoidia bacterium]|nr:MAG: acetyl-CoA acetyltransferase [Dehalococcoidia bacterium]
MAQGIKDRVAIIGMGCTRFGEHWDKSPDELMVEAAMEAIEDAGIDKKDIGAAWSGTCYEETNIGKSAIALSVALKLPFIGSTRVENWCATGSEALRGASYAVAAGAYDVCLAVGVEKLKDTGYGGLPQNEVQWGTVRRLVDANQTAPGMFAMLATRYFSRYGIAPEDGKRMLAMISAKSHRNGALNPKAHLRREVTVEQIINAPIVAWPLGLFDCCGVSDGAAAAIVTTAEMASNFRKDPVYVKALQISASSGQEMLYDDDWTHVESTCHAAQRAYAEAGINNPREEISMAEVHDCFSITEAVTMEDLQFSQRGKVKDDIESGFFELTGGLPVQPDGGLKSFGHPVGASGLRMVYEMYKQLQGKAEDRQIKNPKYGLTHNLGGVPSVNVASIIIVGL